VVAETNINRLDKQTNGLRHAPAMLDRPVLYKLSSREPPHKNIRRRISAGIGSRTVESSIFYLVS
jgi:hypothetical protein